LLEFINYLLPGAIREAAESITRIFYWLRRERLGRGTLTKIVRYVSILVKFCSARAVNPRLSAQRVCNLSDSRVKMSDVALNRQIVEFGACQIALLLLQRGRIVLIYYHFLEFFEPSNLFAALKFLN